jgi:hypothetical protein
LSARITRVSETKLREDAEHMRGIVLRHRSKENMIAYDIRQAIIMKIGEIFVL